LQLRFLSISIILKYNDAVRYFDVIGRTNIINPGEIKTLHALIYMTEGVELPQYPQPPFNFQGNLGSEQDRTRLEKAFQEWVKIQNRLQKRFQKIEDFAVKIAKAIKQEFGLTDNRHIKDIIKTMQLSLTFQSNIGNVGREVFCNKIISLNPNIFSV
jgi:hypothetical protein